MGGGGREGESRVRVVGGGGGSESAKIDLTISSRGVEGEIVLGVGVGGSVTSTPLPRIKPKIFQTQRGDVVWVQVPEVGHVVVGRHPHVGVVPHDHRPLQHKGLRRQQHVRPRGPGPEQHPLRGF